MAYRASYQRFSAPTKNHAATSGVLGDQAESERGTTRCESSQIGPHARSHAADWPVARRHPLLTLELLFDHDPRLDHATDGDFNRLLQRASC